MKNDDAKNVVGRFYRRKLESGSLEQHCLVRIAPIRQCRRSMLFAPVTPWLGLGNVTEAV